MTHAPIPARGPARRIDTRVQFGVAGPTRIRTADGAIPAALLRPGDRILTREAGLQPLRGLYATRHEGLAPIRVAPSALGHGRPAAALLLAPDQLVLVRDWRAQTLYGAAHALVPAARLVDGCSVIADACKAHRLFALIFDTPHIVYAEGVEIAMALCTTDLDGATG